MQDTFNSGYTQALVHLQHVFEQMVASGIPINKKSVQSYMKTAIENRSELRETGFIKGLKYSKQNGFYKG